MWRCLNCETINDGEVCVICGEPKPSDEQLAALQREEEAKKAEELRKTQSIDETPQPPVTGYAPVPPTAPPMTGYTPAPAGAPPYAPPVPKKRTGLIVFIVILVMLIIGGAGFGVYYILNNDSGVFSEAVDNDKAKYDEAVSLLYAGDEEGAKAKFEELGSYSDSEEMVKECDYRIAQDKAATGSYIEAYDMFDDLGDYKDSQTKMNELKKDIYSEGIEYYYGNSYDEAERHFEYVMGYDRADDYLLLIDAHNDDLYDVSQLYDIIGFEDANEVIIDKYAYDFLKGYWESYNGKNLSFYDEGNSQWCSNNFATPEGDNWKIEDGIHYVGSDSTRWLMAWSYTLVDEDTITVYNYTDDLRTTMYRK